MVELAIIGGRRWRILHIHRGAIRADHNDVARARDRRRHIIDQDRDFEAAAIACAEAVNGPAANAGCAGREDAA